jgi:GNAT superfamily N-acetyltransferase
MALWVPPGVPELEEVDEADLEEALDRVCGARAALVLEGFERFAAIRPTTPHWYLSMLATRPDHRGRGLGMALVADRLRALDNDGLPAHLESTNPANLERYSQVGFELSGSFELPGGPTVDTMWRPARTEDRILDG